MTGDELQHREEVKQRINAAMLLGATEFHEILYPLHEERLAVIR